MRKSAYELMSPRIEKYLSERDRPQTVKEIAEVLGVATSSIHSVMQLMEVFKVIQMVHIMGRQRYFLKGVYDDEQLSAMFPPEIIPRVSKRLKSAARRTESPMLQVQESFLEEHLAAMRLRASGGEGPSALAMVGLNQIDVVRDEVVPGTLLVLRPVDRDIKAEERQVENPKRIESFNTVEHLSKDVRQLSRGQTRHLKEQLKGLEGYYRIESLDAAFAEFSALKRGEYGTVFYFAFSTNPWEKVYRVTVDDALPLEIEAPFRGRRNKYDPIIDQFLESGHVLVEIDVEGKRSNYVQSQLKKRIEKRGLKIVSSSLRGSVYLERKR